MKTLRWIGAIGVAFATQACVVRDQPSVNAGYYPHGRTANVSVATPQPYAVSTMPPEPLFEQMTPSPGYGYVWIDGSWHWNGYEWVWVSGRWEQDQTGQVYVQPYYDYSGDTYIYTPGYWSSRDRLPRGAIVRDHRDGRPSQVVAPSSRPYQPRPSAGRPEPSLPGYRPESRPAGHDAVPTSPPPRPYLPPNRQPARDLDRPPPGPVTSPPVGPDRPPTAYDPNTGGTYRPAPSDALPSVPVGSAGQPPNVPIGGRPAMPPPADYGPPTRTLPPPPPPGYRPPPRPMSPPTYAPPARPPGGYAHPTRTAPPTYAPPARPAGPPARTAPPPARPAPPPPPPPANNNPPARGRR